jgi:hypothetical protein
MKFKTNQNPYFGIAPTLGLKPVQIYILHILKDVVDEMKLFIHPSVLSSIHPSCHPSMDGITAAHVVKILL